MSESNLPDWEQLLSAAAHLQPLSERLGPDRVEKALDTLDELYPQTSGESALQQLQVQLANPMPYDLENTDLSEYRQLHPQWHDWTRVKEICATIAVDLFKGL